MRRLTLACSGAALLGGVLVVLTGCPAKTDAARCTTPPPESCAPLYTPTFHELFTRTLAPTCGLPGSSCHGSDGRQHGLAFVDEQEAYDLLTSKGLVHAGDPACSEMMFRVMSSDPNENMPPGKALDPGAKCVIRQWIANGAKR